MPNPRQHRREQSRGWSCALLLAPAAASATTVKKQLNIVDLLQESELIVRGRVKSVPGRHRRAAASPTPR